MVVSLPALVSFLIDWGQYLLRSLQAHSALSIAQEFSAFLWVHSWELTETQTSLPASS